MLGLTVTVTWLHGRDKQLECSAMLRPIFRSQHIYVQNMFKYNTYMHTTTIVPHLKQCEFNMFAANPTFARIGSRISFDMFKSLRRASVFYFAKSKTLNP